MTFTNPLSQKGPGRSPARPALDPYSQARARVVVVGESLRNLFTPVILLVIEIPLNLDVSGGSGLDVEEGIR